MQTSPLTFMAIFEACRLILAPQHMFPLILLGLRILKWGETFLKINFGIRGTKGGGQKKNKKKVVILLQPLSVYLPTPIVVKKATFLIFFDTYPF